MKIKILLTSAGLSWGSCLLGAPLSSPTAVQTQPNPASPVIAILAAGTEQPAPSQKATAVPDGWIGVDLQGPFTGYVRNRDLDKQLEVKAGSSIYIGPKEDSGVLAVVEKGDKADITGLHGGWTQVSLVKTITGYIAANPSAQAPSAAPLTAPAAAPAAAAPASTFATAPGSAVSAAPAAPQGTKAAPAQIFEGKLTSSESFLYPHRPFKWQLSDASGNRIAYVNLEGLLLTDQVDAYTDHQVVVLGTVRPVKETRDLVIDVEAFHLK
jgi:hypothetical protein